tara:strand:+ start:2256 stop:2453 length:198 start_codon:yes stop_codon:yes gene_type:complete
MVLEQLQKIISDLSKAAGDADKFDNKDNASAGRRVRKASMQAIKDLRDLRKEVMDELNRRKSDEE